MKKRNRIVSSIFVVVILIFLVQMMSPKIILKDNSSTTSFSYYIDDVLAFSPPQKNENYVFDELNSNCSDNVTVSWDYENWGAKFLGDTVTKTRCYLKFKTKYRENVLNGTDPVLKKELIPITIDKDGTVRKADLSTEWYNYEKKEWANAVILRDESSIAKYKATDVISEENIESYFVWIPKYRYQLWNLGDYDVPTVIDENMVHEVSIIFGDYNTSDSVSGECTTPMISGSTESCEVDDYMTHPAFLSIPSTGFWVGKFEPSRNGGEKDDCLNGDILEIKPNVSSWRNISISNAFYTSYNYKRHFDSHMMKNTERGAVAYLSHSKYGNTSIRLNNHSNYVTGYASNTKISNIEYCTDNVCNSPYNTDIGNFASTTGNISGIYDMSGGAWEYMMSNMKSENGNFSSGRNDKKNSGFLGDFTYVYDGINVGKKSLTINDGAKPWLASKYYDSYIYGESYKKGYLGDATKELGPFGIVENKFCSSWFSSIAYQISFPSPWSERGGDISIFSFTRGDEGGSGTPWNTFRVILTPAYE